jgi:hypothetical protein
MLLCNVLLNLNWLIANPKDYKIVDCFKLDTSIKK